MKKWGVIAGVVVIMMLWVLAFSQYNAEDGSDIVEYTQENISNDLNETVSFGSVSEENLSDVIVSTDGNISSQYMGEYAISDSTYGTEVEVTITDGIRYITSNAIANHETWDFPNSANPNTISEQERSWELTTTPKYVGWAEWARENGVAYNGVKFELETNERVICESGEVYRIEWFETFFNVMGIDENNAHVQPTWEYHYHWAPIWAIELLEWEDIVHVGFASDGFPIYYSKLWTYTPSFKLVSDTREWTACTYTARTTTDVIIEGTIPDGTYDRDWEYIDDLWDLDSCNGTYIDGEYVYFMTDDFPYGPRCMNGEYSMWGWWAWGQWWPPPSGAEGAGPPRR